MLIRQTLCKIYMLQFIFLTTITVMHCIIIIFYMSLIYVDKKQLYIISQIFCQKNLKYQFNISDQDSIKIVISILIDQEMGNIGQKIRGTLSKKQEYNIFLGGLNSSGKTTLLYTIKLGKTVQTIPTIGFNVENIQIQNKKLFIIDVGGGHMIRPLFKHYLEGVHGLAYVIRDRDLGDMNIIIKDLWDYHLSFISIQIPILFLWNTSEQRQHDEPDFAALEKDLLGRRYLVKQCNAKTGQGLKQGITWLANQIAKKQSQK